VLGVLHTSHLAEARQLDLLDTRIETVHLKLLEQLKVERKSIPSAKKVISLFYFLKVSHMCKPYKHGMELMFDTPLSKLLAYAPHMLLDF
jgi:hypothetical protein